MTESPHHALPTTGTERIIALDVLRGFAVLGILVMNIQSFSMIESAYLNPSAWGDLTGLNFITWATGHLLADTKFMGLFSMLFGAGIVLFAERLEQRGQRPGPMHYRRIFWLWVIGLIHAYFFWHGDILVGYAACAVTVYLFRKRRPTTLLILGFLSLLIPSLIMGGLTMALPHMPADAMAEQELYWQPNAEMIAEELAVYRGGFLGQIPHRLESSLSFQLFVFWVYTAWRAGGLMLIGMALFKTGVLTGQRSSRFYRLMLGIGLLIGVPVIILGIRYNTMVEWDMARAWFTGGLFNAWGSLGIIAAYVGLIMLLVRSTVLPGLQSRLATVGRMAFTNYLGQTLICTLIFYGHGLGLFCKMERWQQMLIVLAIWALQLWLSPLWLRYFRFGPMEWAWRSLTYWQLQPMRRV